jgi:multisubunit Na+/H+ antiporter MnhG subunit
MPKEPATALGMTLRIMSLAAFITVVGHFWIVPAVSIKVWAVITAAVLSPAVAIAIYQQVSLRRALAREKGG